MRRSFALRLAAAFAGIGIAAAALTAILVNFAFGARFTGYLEEQRGLRSDQLVAALADSYERMKGWDAKDLDALAPLALMDGGTLRLVDPAGRAVWEPSQGHYSAAMAEMHARMMGSGPLGPERRLPIRVDGTLTGAAIVRLPEAGLLPQDVAFRASINRLLLFGGLVAGLAALALGVVLARRATAPARELTRVARAVAGGERSRRVEFEAPDEFGDMAHAFNTMAEAIEEEDRLRKAFASSVAHELRTPLAILRSQVEALQDGVMRPTSATFGSLHEEVLRLSRLVRDLETLASADAAEFSLERRPLSLGPLVEQVALEFAGPFASKNVRLETVLGRATVDADATRMQQVVSNLLSNALKFTPAGGSVRVEVNTEDGRAALRISDTGAGIAPDELPHVFDRFFRGRGSGAGGSGVGLTVVRELVKAHGGEVEARSAPGDGSVFTVRLPAVSSPQHGVFTGSSHRSSTLPS